MIFEIPIILQNVVKKEMFTQTILEMLLFEGRSVLFPTQWNIGNKKVKGSLEENEVIILGNFAENYNFFV